MENARNNLAAREGSPYKGSIKGYDLTHIFYIKKLSPFERKKSYEVFIDEFPNWVMLKNYNNHQQLPIHLIKEFVHYTIDNGADAVIWAALPSNVDVSYLDILIKKDKLFVKNSHRYIESLPPGNILTTFEKNIMKNYHALDVN